MSPDNNIINPALFEELKKNAPSFAERCIPISDPEAELLEHMNRHERRAALARFRKKK